MDLFRKCEDQERVEVLKQKGMYPYFHCLTSQQAPEVKMDGKEIIMIGSNNYLGLTSDEEVVEAGFAKVRFRLFRKPIPQRYFGLALAVGGKFGKIFAKRGCCYLFHGISI